jgi:hypothetical protein
MFAGFGGMAGQALAEGPARAPQLIFTRANSIQEVGLLP